MNKFNKNILQLISGVLVFATGSSKAASSSSSMSGDEQRVIGFLRSVTTVDPDFVEKRDMVVRRQYEIHQAERTIRVNQNALNDSGWST